MLLTLLCIPGNLFRGSGVCIQCTNSCLHMASYDKQSWVIDSLLMWCWVKHKHWLEQHSFSNSGYEIVDFSEGKGGLVLVAQLPRSEVLHHGVGLDYVLIWGVGLNPWPSGSGKNTAHWAKAWSCLSQWQRRHLSTRVHPTRDLEKWFWLHSLLSLPTALL